MAATDGAVWGSEDALGYPQTFVTGGGPKVPEALPPLTVVILSVRPSDGGGDCAAFKAATLHANFDSVSEPWVLVPGNEADDPFRVAGAATEVTWEAVDPLECFGIEQVNWAGEVFDSGLEICVPSPGPDAGASPGETDDLDGSTTAQADTAEPGRDVGAPSEEATEAGDSTVGEASATAAPELDAAQPPTLVDSGGSEGVIAGSPKGKNRGGCTLTRAEPSNLVCWFGVLFAGLFWHRRQQNNAGVVAD